MTVFANYAVTSDAGTPFLFHVPRPVGKMFSSSAFGFVIRGETYLFLEEAIYLSEKKVGCQAKDEPGQHCHCHIARGPRSSSPPNSTMRKAITPTLPPSLHVTLSNAAPAAAAAATSEECNISSQRPCSVASLYALLSPSHLPFPCYLSYSNLRSQTYVVFRFDAREFTKSNKGPKAEDPTDLRGLDLKLPQSPRLMLSPDGDEGDADSRCPPDFAFDIYLPSSNFSRSRPGPPYSRVAVLPNEGGCSPSTPLTFSHLSSLASSSPFPVKLAVVSTSGSINWFSVSPHVTPKLPNDPRFYSISSSSVTLEVCNVGASVSRCDVKVRARGRPAQCQQTRS